MTWTWWRTTSSGRVRTLWLHSGQMVSPEPSVQLARSRHPDARQ